jgi:hypothetical protein
MDFESIASADSAIQAWSGKEIQAGLHREIKHVLGEITVDFFPE